MRPRTSQLPTHKGLRGDILVALKRAQPLSASDLARRLAVSPNAVRHHLKELVAESLISYGREQRGVGAPTYAYRLARAGEALFPQAYEETLTQVLEHVAEKAGRPAAVELFEERYRALTRRMLAELEGADAGERVALVTRALSRDTRSGWPSTTVRFAPSRSGFPRCAPRSSGSSKTCWARPSSGGRTFRPGATPANT